MLHVADHQETHVIGRSFDRKRFKRDFRADAGDVPQRNADG